MRLALTMVTADCPIFGRDLLAFEASHRGLGIEVGPFGIGLTKQWRRGDYRWRGHTLGLAWLGPLTVSWPARAPRVRKLAGKETTIP